MTTFSCYIYKFSVMENTKEGIMLICEHNFNGLKEENQQL